MRKTGVRDQFPILQQLYSLGTGKVERNDLIIFAVHNQYRNIHTFKIFCKICFRESLNAVNMSFYSAHHPLAPPVVADALRYFCSLAVEAIKRNGKILEVLRPVVCCPFPYFVKYGHWNTVG